VQLGEALPGGGGALVQVDGAAVRDLGLFGFWFLGFGGLAGEREVVCVQRRGASAASVSAASGQADSAALTCPCSPSSKAALPMKLCVWCD
jgi:hypothetical protein